MRREGLPGRGDRHVPPLLRAAGRGRDRACSRSPRSSRSRTSRSSTTCPRATRRSTQAVVIKLNGGLGTSMGMTQAKSLIEAKDGHVVPGRDRAPGVELRERSGARLPLVLMDSFCTHDDALEALGDFGVRRPARLRPAQGAEDPRRRPEPVEWPDDPSLEWCPPGHGDLYTALLTSGMLDDAARARLPLRVRLELRQPRRGARPADPRLDRARGDPVRDGGDAAAPRRTARAATSRAGPTAATCCARPRRRRDEDLDALQDISRHRYVNTNNLWIDLRVLARRHARARRRPRPAADRQPQDRRSRRQVDARGVPARDRDGRGDRRVRRRAAGRASRAGASLRSRRPRTCWPCARTPTC